ncbi:hypothetical protein BHE74_00058658, partial [Ensete ventricosum]
AANRRQYLPTPIAAVAGRCLLLFPVASIAAKPSITPTPVADQPSSSPHLPLLLSAVADLIVPYR